MPGTDWAQWISAISQLLFLLLFVFLFLGGNQRVQIYLWTNDIKAKLGIIDNMRREAEKKTLDFMLKNKAQDAKKLLEKIKNFFVISPVELEPTDIIRRLEHLILERTREFREEFKRHMPEADEVTRSKAETAAEITAVIDFIHRYVRHLLLTGLKTKNWILIMQLQLVMPQIMQITETYLKALNDFLTGAPIGDSAGPMVALRLAGYDTPWKIVGEDKDTVAAEVDLEGRRLILVKAKGPESNVGRPGYATKLIVEELIEKGVKPSMIITVDAALKLEGEETGIVAEGIGAAIGDIGPEKIKFERSAAHKGIPLKAVIIKMGLEEAILTMRKPIADAIDKAVEKVKEIILKDTQPGDTVVVVGVGNSIGVGQQLAAS
ncbi:MAG: DUF1512 domain-containing protein [Desulfurococcales archaeon]|nr:DUF1512 domain-containing protein [Desulfurococcales archaeon]